MNSLQSWAASVLLCAITRAGLPTFCMTLAIVKVLPLPVTPRSTCALSPLIKPSLNLSIACCWSSEGVNLETNSKALFSISIKNYAYFLYFSLINYYTINTYHKSIFKQIRQKLYLINCNFNSFVFFTCLRPPFNDIIIKMLCVSAIIEGVDYVPY